MAFVFCIVGSAAAQSLTVVTEEWPPYNHTEKGQVAGVVTEVVRATLERAGIDYTINVYPWARAYDMAQNRENVLIYSIFRLPIRERLFKWIQIDGLFVNMHLFRPSHRTDIDATTLDKAKQYRIGVTRDTSTHHFLLDNGFEDGVNLFPVKSEELNIIKANRENERIDLTTGDTLSLACWLKASGYPSDYWVRQAFLFKREIYMAFSINTSDELVERVHTAFHALKAEGEIDAIVERCSKNLQ